METAVANFVEPGAKVAILANGYFCDRITEMGIAFLPFTRLSRWRASSK
jgi:aspartate aminotransferase-like enzyme